MFNDALLDDVAEPNQRPSAILMMSLVGVETSSADDLSEARIALSTK